MRRIVAALFIAVLALALVACGSDTTTTPAAGTPAAVPAAVTPETPATSVPTDPVSPAEPVNNEPFPTSKSSTPLELLQRLDAKQPMLIFLYDPTQQTTNDVRGEVDTAAKKYRGLIDLITFDTSSALSTDARSGDAEVKKWAETLTSIKVSFTPYCLFVDRYGRIVGRLNGDMDAEIIEKRILAATQ